MLLPVMPEKNITTESKMSPKKCSCCPYGFHIDRDFVRYCDSLYNSAQLDKLRQHKRERRKEKKSVESYLGLANVSLERKRNHIPAPHQNLIHSTSENFSKEFYLHNDDLKNAVNDFEDTWKKSLTKSFSSHVIDCKNGIKQTDCLTSYAAHDGSLSSVNSEDTRENKLSSLHVSRSSSQSSVSSHSTTQSHIFLDPISDDSSNSFVSGFNSSLSSLSKPLSNVPHQTVGINKSILTNIREQMASSLLQMKELEEQVKSIHALKVKISILAEEKKTLLNELKVRENMIYEAKNSVGENDLQKQLKKLENEGIMSPTLSKKCLSLRHHKSDNLFSPAIASSLDATMIKKDFIDNEIISHLRMNDFNNSDKLKCMKNVGTSCNVLTRDIGVGYIPNKYKSIAVGNEFSTNDCLTLFKRGHFEKQTSVSSGSLESDLDSLSGTGDTPRFSSEYQLKQVSLNQISVNNISLQKAFVDTSTNTECNYSDKCVNTEKEYSFDSKKIYSPEKSVRHKSISVSPSVNNKYIQVSNKHAFKHIGLQTSESKIRCSQLVLPYTRDIGSGNFSITDIVCDNCKKCRKSVAIGDSDINAIICKKCNFKTFSTLFVNIGVGDFDINVLSCERCEEKILKEKNLNITSTGTNTTSDLSLSKREIYICDKCSETIHSVAQDLAADCKEKSILDITSNISKIQTSKSKISKLKPQIKPLNIGESNSPVKSVTLFKQPQLEKEVSISGRYKFDNIEQKDNENLSQDTDCNIKSFSSEILPQFTNLPHVPRKKNELTKEIKAACKVLNDQLQKADHVNEKKTLSSLNIIQIEWFKAANQKKADPHLIEDYIDAFEDFSKLLLHKIVNLSDSNGNTALHYAVSYGNFDVVSILIDSKVCDVNMKNKAGYTSIMLVALAEMRNDTHHYVVHRLFSIGDINVKATQNGQTALMLAVSHGKKDIVKILLDVGAEINLQDKDGSTALMCAAEHGHLEIAKTLLSHAECDPTLVDNDGCTALTIAMEAGHKDIGLLIYANMNFSRGSSPYSTLKTRKRSTPRSTPPPHTPTLRTPPLPSPATKSMNSLTSSYFS